METTSKRIFGLDVVRASAISLVLIAHTSAILFPLIKIPIIGFIIGKLIAINYHFGVVGVELFFVLSGFLIGTILIKENIETNVNTNKGLFHFWKMRWMRTLPAYYFVMIIICFLNKYILFQPTPFSFFIFTQNLVTPHPPVFGEAWSLSVEEWSYLILPFLFLVIRKFLQKKKAFLNILISYLFFFFAFRIINAFDPMFADIDKGIRKIVLFRLDAVAWGILIAYFNLYYRSRLILLRKGFFYIGLCGILIISALNYLGFHPKFNYYNTSNIFRFLIDAFLYTLYPVFAAMLLPAALCLKATSNIFITKIITKLSALSYTLYLTHAYIVLQLMEKYFVVTTISGCLIFFVAYLILAFSAAIILHKLIEIPFINLRNKIK